MTLKTSCGILLLLGLLSLVQLHFTIHRLELVSTSEFSILPNSNTPCPMRPCYTLSQAMDNPSNYLTSNTTVVFPPGHHEVSTEGQLVIQNVNNISLVGDNDISIYQVCRRAFINITVSKLYFSMCGAPLYIHSTNIVPFCGFLLGSHVRQRTVDIAGYLLAVPLSETVIIRAG